MVLRQTSLDAYNSVKPRIGDRHKQVADVLAIYGPLADLDISMLANLPINCVTPRRGELVQMGFVEEHGTKLGVNGVKVLLWKIV